MTREIPLPSHVLEAEPVVRYSNSDRLLKDVKSISGTIPQSEDDPVHLSSVHLRWPVLWTVAEVVVMFPTMDYLIHTHKVPIEKAFRFCYRSPFPPTSLYERSRELWAGYAVDHKAVLHVDLAFQRECWSTFFKQGLAYVPPSLRVPVAT